MAESIFDRVVVERVELREQLADGQAFEVLALNGGEGLPQIASLRVVATGSLLAALEGDAETWVAEAIERGAASLANDGNKLNVLQAREIVFDARYVIEQS